MNQIGLVIASVGLIFLSHSSPTFAADPSGGESTSVTAEDSGLGIGASAVAPAHAGSFDQPPASDVSPESAGLGTTVAPPLCTTDLVQPCTPVVDCVPFAGSPTGYTLQGQFGIEGPWGHCTPDNGEAAAAEPARITPGRVLQAFRRIPLPAAKLDIQPPGGKTMVNLDTIFSTTTGDLDRTVTLLGRRVQLRITPASYTWHHGDGTTQTSDWPGRPWEKDLDMSTYLTHAYTDAHVTVRPSVDVTYTADYRVGTGPWQAVDGTVTIEGPPSALRIVEARPVLTGDGH